MATIDQTFARLQKSTFRARFHLTEKDRQYIADKGLDTIQHHAADFVRTRLAPADIPHDHIGVWYQCGQPSVNLRKSIHKSEKHIRKNLKQHQAGAQLT